MKESALLEKFFLERKMNFWLASRDEFDVI